MAEPRTTPPDDIAGPIAEEALARGIPPELAFGILGAENGGFDSLSATRHNEGSGAKGLWQLTPIAVKEAGYDPKTFDYFDAGANTEAAIRYIKQLKQKFNGNPTYIAAAYNWGEGNLRKHLAAGGGIDDLPDGATQNGATNLENDVQGYLLKANDFSGGYLADERNRSSVASAAPTPAVEPKSVEQTALPPDIAQQYGDTGAGASWLYDNILKPTVKSAVQFPSELGQNILSAITPQWGPPGSSQLDFLDNPPPIDPMGAVNFGLVVAPQLRVPLLGGGRLAAGVAASGIGVLQAADAIARQKLLAAGKKPEERSIGDWASDVYSELTTSQNLDEVVGGAAFNAAFGFVTGKNTKADDVRIGAGRYTKLEAEDITGLPRVSRLATDRERLIFNQEARRRVEAEFSVPTKNPASKIYQQIIDEHGERELTGPGLDALDTRLAALRSDAGRRGILRGDLDINTQPIDPAFPLKQEMKELQKEAYATGNPARIAQARAKTIALQAQIDALPAPTTALLMDRMMNFDKMRRNAAFNDTILQENHRYLELLQKASHDFRAEDGLVGNVLNARENIPWRRANALTNAYYEDKRALRLIADTFKDGLEGGNTLRNVLTSGKKEKIINSLGQERYDRLLKLSRAVDTLNHSANGSRVIDMITKGYAALQSPIGLGIAATVGATASGAGPGAVIGAATSGALLGTLLTNRSVQRSFERLVRASSNLASKTYTRAFTQFMSAAMIHESIAASRSAGEPTEDQAATDTHEPAPAPPAPLPLPPLASRPTGVRVPAPSPSRTPSLPTFPGPKVLQ